MTIDTLNVSFLHYSIWYNGTQNVFNLKFIYYFLGFNESFTLSTHVYWQGFSNKTSLLEINDRLYNILFSKFIGRAHEIQKTIYSKFIFFCICSIFVTFS
jgi:hypothetical protein